VGNGQCVLILYFIQKYDFSNLQNFAQNRIKTVIREIRRYGVVDVFEVEDLIELKNIPKVTKCLAQLSKLAASDKDSLLASNLDIPH